MEFKVLGPLVVSERQTAIYVPAGRQRTILAHLLLRREKVVSVDELIEDLWDGRPPPGGRSTLYSYMTRLRESLADNGGLIKTVPHGYIINVGENDVDLQRFMKLHAYGQRARESRNWQGSAEYFSSALDLWRGEPFVDVDSLTLHRDEVPVLQELHLSTLSGHIGAELRLGRHTTVVADLRRLVAAWPSREEFSEQLMLALYRSRRQSDALAVYREVRRNLVDELGVEPGAELQNLHERILASDETLTGPRDDDMPGRRAIAVTRTRPEPVAPAELPSTVADFTGRHEQVSELCRVLRDVATASANGPGGVVAITGPCGIGKTAFAVHVAHQVKDHFPDGQIFLDLHCSTDGQERLDTIFDRLGRVLGIEDSKISGDIDERSAVIRSVMTGKRILITLDDASDAAQVRPLLPGTPSCAVVVTSRSRLAALTVSHRIALDYLDPDESRRLFAKIVGPERVAAEQPAVEQVLSACAGSPLAVRILGQRLATRPGWSVQELAHRVVERRHRLGELQLGDLAVRNRLDASYADLSQVSECADGPARAFRLLSLWPGTDLSLSASAALLGQPHDVTESNLERLVDLHLLESPSGTRYRFHELTYSYARERAERHDSAEARTAAVNRILLWYLRTVDAAAHVLGQGREPVDSCRGAPSPREPGAASLTFCSPGEARGWLATERQNVTIAIGRGTRREHLYRQLETALRDVPDYG